MKDSEFLDADFTGSTAVDVMLFRAVFSGAKLDSCDFSFSDFTGAGLEEVTFINSRLYKVNFQGAHLQNADFRGADVKGCNFFGVEFENTNFEGAINIAPEIEALMVEGKITGVCSVGGNEN